MKQYGRINVPGMLLIIFTFTMAMIVLVAVIDILIAPILRELLQEQAMRHWCGIFVRCVSHTQRSLAEYMLVRAPWRGTFDTITWLRLKKAALFGAAIGSSWIAVQLLGRRKK